MTRYQYLTIKRYVEQAIMFPFILLGRMITIFFKRWDFDIYFLLPIYGLGGAEYVHAEILKVVSDKKVLLIFTKKSNDTTTLKMFEHNNVHIIDVSKWTDNKWIYWSNFIVRGFFASQISRNKVRPKLFIGQCNFGYKLTPHILRDIKIYEIIHLFDQKFCNVWMPFVAFLDKRICVAQNEIDKINDYMSKAGVPPIYSARLQEVRLFVDMPNDIKPKHKDNTQLKVYYAGRGTSQKRLWIHFEVARKAKELELPITFYYVGNFENELPHDIEQFANYSPPIQAGKQMYEFIADKNILLLTSASEGFPIALLEAMNLGIVPIVTPVGGMPTAIKQFKNGILLDNDNENAIITSAIEALKLLSSNRSLYNNMSIAIKETYDKDYSKQQFYKFIRAFLDLD